MIPTLPTWDQLHLVMPEIWLAIGMSAILMLSLIDRDSVALPFLAAIAALFAALAAAFMSLNVNPGEAASIPGGMLTIDPFSQFFKVLLIIFTVLVIVQWYIASRPHTAPRDTPDLLCLLLGAALGMALMASASNLLMIFVAIESASFPSFALAGFRKRQRSSSEGSLKYVVFGAASSAMMVYGMSLIYGTTGSLSLAGIAAHAGHHGISPLLAVGLLGMFAGIAFKLSAVPMHFWCPDVFEGVPPIEVATFLSVASKGAAVCLLLRVLMCFAAAAPVHGHAFTGLAVGVAIMGAMTATWGNLVAMHQTRIKRLLAYSSIAQVGYMVMAASLVVFAGHAGFPNPVAGAILFYLLVYLFMNMGAFTVAALAAQHTGTQDIREYAGMIRRSPLLAVMLSLFLLSLFGMPGLGGFMGKIHLATSMTRAGLGGFILIAVLFFNTLLSLCYYFRPIYFMIFVPDRKERPVFAVQPAGALLLAVCAVALLWTGLFPSLAGRLTSSFATLESGNARAVMSVRQESKAVEISQWWNDGPRVKQSWNRPYDYKTRPRRMGG